MKTHLLSRSSVAALFLLSSLPALAAPPTVNITAPTSSAGIIEFSSFPQAQPISFDIAVTTKRQGRSEVDAATGDVNEMTVTVEHPDTTIDTLFSDRPFNASNSSNPNLCTAELIAAADACTVASDFNSAAVTLPWSVPARGVYTITVQAKISSETGEDVEVVEYALTVSAEDPAPPSVANAYINANLSSISGKKRGCVISKIAEQHAKFEAYGPKGGPYAIEDIHTAVNTFAAVCR